MKRESRRLDRTKKPNRVVRGRIDSLPLAKQLSVDFRHFVLRCRQVRCCQRVCRDRKAVRGRPLLEDSVCSNTLQKGRYDVGYEYGADAEGNAKAPESVLETVVIDKLVLEMKFVEEVS